MQGLRNDRSIRFGDVTIVRLSFMLALLAGGCDSARELAVQQPRIEEPASFETQAMQAEAARLIAEERDPATLEAAASKRWEDRPDLERMLGKLIAPAEGKRYLVYVERALPAADELLTAVRPLPEFLEKRSELREGFRSLFTSSPALKMTAGEKCGSDFVLFDAVRLAVLWEYHAGLTAVNENRADDALKSLAVMLGAIDPLEESRCFTTALEAIRLRKHVDSLFDAISKLDVDTHKRAFALLRRSMLSRVAPADIVIGERAIGIALFDRVRAGELFSILDRERYVQLDAEGRLAAFARRTLERLEVDEASYLETMRELIELLNEHRYDETDEFLTRRIELMNRSPDSTEISRLLLNEDFKRNLREITSLSEEILPIEPNVNP